MVVEHDPNKAKHEEVEDRVAALRAELAAAAADAEAAELDRAERVAEAEAKARADEARRKELEDTRGERMAKARWKGMKSGLRQNTILKAATKKVHIPLWKQIEREKAAEAAAAAANDGQQ